MAIRDLLDRMLKQAGEGGTLDWVPLRNEIHAEHQRATTTAEREACLGAYKALMDSVERQLRPGDLATFRTMREQDYNLLLVTEAMIGRTDGNVPPDRLAAITRREVSAGRMLETDELHKLALAGDAILTPQPSKPGFFRRLFSKS